MKATRDGRLVTLSWDLATEKLMAPDGPDGPRQYLPCDICGELMQVSLDCVPGMCMACSLRALIDLEDELDQPDR